MSAPPEPRSPAQQGCLTCGRELRYLESPREAGCVFCGQVEATQAECEAGHFVCDACHAGDALAAIEHLCRTSRETDLVALLRRVRAHPAIHPHGPEHHSLVPALLVTAYANAGGELPEDALRTAIDRGARVPGGFCGFAGSCGAALGVGIGFAVILGSTPLRPGERQKSLGATSEALAAVAGHLGARCCQRDCWTALRAAAELSRTGLPLALAADAPLVCDQHGANRQCMREGCPLFPGAGDGGGSGSPA